jgi:hypothetical protein
MRSGEPVLEETLSHPTINVEGLFGAVVGAIETGAGKCSIIMVRRFCAAVVNPILLRQPVDRSWRMRYDRQK